MSAVSRPPNRLLQALPSTEYAQLHPLLETVDLTKETVLADAGAPVQRVYFPHGGVVSMMVNLSDHAGAAGLFPARRRGLDDDQSVRRAICRNCHHWS